MFLVYNSDILPESDFHLSVNDRAFQYGDGLFETIRYEHDRIWFWTDHFARLSAGMSTLHLNWPETFTAETLDKSIRQLISENGLTNQPARIKIQVWRQPGGLYTPTTNGANVLITARPGNPFSITEKAATGLYDAFLLSPSPVSAFKTLNALPYALAGLYKTEHNLDEVILLDSNGHLAESMASNLFWYADETIYTPSLQTGCINGIIRRQLLRIAPVVGLTVREGFFRPDVLSQAETIFCANVMGIQWLRNVNAIHIPSSANAENRLESMFSQLHI